MKTLLEFKAQDGSSFFVEVDEQTSIAPTTRGGVDENNNRGIIQTATNSFDTALKPLKEVSNGIINCIKELANSPNDIEVELGLKFTAKAGIIVTSLDSEANFKIVLKWHNNNVEHA
ncbi:MAG: hypothetical protein JWR67_2218 [Mucilaginibacter sp.]|nr:hypothetical protein [Mucilaginibacter sp.]